MVQPLSNPATPRPGSVIEVAEMWRGDVVVFQITTRGLDGTRAHKRRDGQRFVDGHQRARFTAARKRGLRRKRRIIMIVEA